MATQPRLLTAQEVADLFRVSVYTVGNWRRSGELEGVRLPGGGGWRFRSEDVEKFLERAPEREPAA